MAFGERKTFPHLLNTTQIADRLGLKIGAGFIEETLGVAPELKDKAARYWTPANAKQAFDLLEKRISVARIKLAAQINEGYFEEGGGAFTEAKNPATTKKPADAGTADQTLSVDDDLDDL
jgi:hypothetical protein